ncbi:MAG: sensor histidine kinase [Vagococcus sp.]
MKNAMLYGEENSEIRIVGESHETGVMIHLSNRSDTLSEEAMSMMFDKFIRLNRARTTENAGAGLRLAISKDTIEAHGGTIHVTSRDKTSVFHIWLPDMILS